MPDTPIAPSPTAAMLTIGNEILSGRTQDKNMNYLAKTLSEIGVRLTEARVVADDETAIIDAVNSLRSSYSYVFTSGGIGPTHDDITTDCIAKAFGVKAEIHPEAFSRLEKHYENTDQPFNAARQKMARIPEGAALIDNPISAAPGFILKNVHVMAGVPAIFQAMIDFTKPLLTHGKTMLSRSITTNITEGTLATELGEIQLAHPSTDIGSYPHIRDGKLGLSIVVRAIDTTALNTTCEEVKALIQKNGGKIFES